LPQSPALAPEPMPVISCSDCYDQCYRPCDASIRSQCSGECDGVEGSCNSCKTTVIANCKASRNCTDSCDECNDAPNGSCTSACTTRYCDACKSGRAWTCYDTCSKECDARNCVHN
jgi:hypothetical protein